MSRFRIAAVALGLLMMAGAAESSTIVYGVQAASGNIVTLDPTTGAVLASFGTPQAIAAGDTNAGLSYAQQLDQLLYFNQDVSMTLYRLDPVTGAVVSSTFGDSFTNAGLSYEQNSGTDYLYYDHQNADVHRQTGFGGSTQFFFTGGTPTGGLGGDGYGREFGIFGGFINEYNFLTGATINSFATPAGALGLAFDGLNLYLSNNQGQLLTLNPDTGAVLNTVSVAGGNLLELGANANGPTAAPVPEPASLVLLGTGLVAAVRRRRARQ